MKKYLLLLLLLAAGFEKGTAQNVSKRSRRARTDTPSVVVLRPREKAVVDSTALQTEPAKKRKRRFGVKVVPAPPVGRSWQEIRYSDSLGKRP